MDILRVNIPHLPKTLLKCSFLIILTVRDLQRVKEMKNFLSLLFSYFC